MEEKQARIILNMVEDIGPVRFKSLLEYFGTAGQVLSASLADLRKAAGITEKIARSIFQWSDKLDWEKELDLIEKNKIKVWTLQDEDYPFNLKNIPDAPPVLYVQGEMDKTDTLSVAVVGTRKSSNYGRAVTEKFSQELARRKITVVSGLARGIDTFAHQSALTAKGRTIAVLGNGLSRIYPAENKNLARRIAENGAVVSELSLEKPPSPENFPRRNRIISGLTLGTVVVEAGEKSGALITARYALEQGREVFAVPGNIFSPVSSGTHRLIKEGAKLTAGLEDILEEIETLQLHWQRQEPKTIKQDRVDLNKDEVSVYDLLSCEPQHIDVLVDKSGVGVEKIAQVLMFLEMKGRVKQFSGKYFVRLD